MRKSAEGEMEYVPSARHRATGARSGRSVEDDEVQGPAEELRVLWIEANAGRVGNELLVDLPAGHGPACSMVVLRMPRVDFGTITATQSGAMTAPIAMPATSATTPLLVIAPETALQSAPVGELLAISSARTAISYQLS